MDKFLSKEEISKQEVEAALLNASNQTSKILDDLDGKFKRCVSENGFYPKAENNDWTIAFFTGENWLLWEHTGDEKFKKAAVQHIQSFKERFDNKVQIDTHDLGFLYSLSCVAGYKLLGNETGKEYGIKAANHLITRFVEKGNYVQAWGKVGAEDNSRLIIDCMMNMPLLFWATEVTGDSKYAEIAKKHLETTTKYIIRDDNSTYHTYFFDKEGQPVGGVTHQGYKNDSAWSRGQSWSVYGFALAYKYDKNEKYLEKFCDVADFFIDHLPKDLVPYWDFTFSDGSDEPRDSSAAAIAICGMLEAAKYLPKEKAEYYSSIAKKMLRALYLQCSVSDYSKSNGLMLFGTYARNSEFNTCTDRGLNECNTWGDYYYLEALIRLTKDWQLYW